jgi:lipopolysaccharide export LptBFGC system permease protein LptF
LGEPLRLNHVRAPKTATVRRFAFSRSYAIWVTGQIALHLLFIVLLFEGLFLSEHFLDLLRDFADEVGSIFDLFLLVIITAPQIQFALPVATLIAVYLVVFRSRERRELIVLAGIGFGGRQIAVLAAAWGAAALLASLTITGFVLPYAKYGFRSELIALRGAAIRSGGASEHFYSFPGYTVFKWPTSGDDQRSALFIYNRRDNEADQVISIGRAAVVGSAQPEMLDLVFGDVVAVDLPRLHASSSSRQCPQCAGNDAIMAVEHYARRFNLNQLLRLEPRGSAVEEWTSPELLTVSPAPARDISELERDTEWATRLVRGLVCFTAPFFALLAVASTTRQTRAFALAVACGVVFCLDVAGLALAKSVAPTGLGTVTLSAILLFVALLVSLVWQVIVWQSALIRPSLSKA